MTDTRPIIDVIPSLAKIRGICMTPGCDRECVQFPGCYHCDDCRERWEAEQTRRVGMDRLWSLANKDIGLIDEVIIRSTFKISQTSHERGFVPSYSDGRTLTYRQARAWTGNTCVFITGDTGAGKSYLGACLLNSYFQRRMDAWREAGGIDNGLAPMPTIGAVSGLTFTEIIKGYQISPLFFRLRDAGCIMLDDIDKAPWSDRALSFLHDFLDKRRAHDRPTIIVSETDGDGLKQLWQSMAIKSRAIPGAILDRLNLGRDRRTLALELRGASLRGVA